LEKSPTHAVILRSSLIPKTKNLPCGRSMHLTQKHNMHTVNLFLASLLGQGLTSCIISSAINTDFYRFIACYIACRILQSYKIKNGVICWVNNYFFMRNCV